MTQTLSVNLETDFDWEWIARTLDPKAVCIQVSPHQVNLLSEIYGEIQMNYKEATGNLDLAVQVIPMLDRALINSCYEVARYRYRYPIVVIDRNYKLSSEQLSERIETALTAQPQRN
ncbi:hypothetical protein ACQ4M3_20570 [Leptolyngbya sp. AN03gr2]|uniref:hypothetical protein n=1 Tax=unclassified Leptolyngbya TaxID=2650499 RepID=UPI003D31021E